MKLNVAQQVSQTPFGSSGLSKQRRGYLKKTLTPSYQIMSLQRALSVNKRRDISSLKKVACLAPGLVSPSHIGSPPLSSFLPLLSFVRAVDSRLGPEIKNL